MNKRHAKPTSAQLIDRIYRKHLAFEAAILAEHDDQTAQYRHVKDMLETLISGQRMLSERMESFRVLADHCARLLREKETLMKMGSLHTDYERLVKQFPEQVKSRSSKPTISWRVGRMGIRRRAHLRVRIGLAFTVRCVGWCRDLHP